MKRLLLSLLFINAFHLYVAAFPDKDLVVISLDAVSGSGIKSIRRITFNEGVMIVDMKDGTAMSWDTDWVNCVMFRDSEPEHETVVSGVAPPVLFSVKENMLFVDCFVSVRVSLIACDGKVVYDGFCTGEFYLDMSSLPAGMYMLKLDGCTYKIINR